VNAVAVPALRPLTRPLGSAPVDVAIACAVLAGSVAILAHGGLPAVHAGARLDPLSGALAAVATLPLVAWRRAPFAVFVLAATMSALAAALGYAFGIPLAAPAALYLLAVSRSEARPWTSPLASAVAGLFVAHVAATTGAHGGVPANELIHVLLAWAVVWFAGERTRLRREHITDLEQRALRTEREAASERAVAAAEERARIARDLHDSAGHAISVIAVRAGAARLRHDEDPERSRAALVAIEQLARETAAEIDAIVGALRKGARTEPDAEAPPGLASLGTLVARHASAGLDVALDVRGTPRPLEGPVDLAAYRILQEALTNAARHGDGRARVEVAFGEDDLELTVVNRVPAARRAQGLLGGGHGVVGMRERAALLGGELDARSVDGAFHLRARLPSTRSRP
jgi:signal transduction histidine kinase